MLTQPSHRRTIPITLQEIPETVRMTAARKACKQESSPDVRTEIVLAAVWPSATVYWVAAGALDRIAA